MKCTHDRKRFSEKCLDNLTIGKLLYENKYQIPLTLAVCIAVFRKTVNITKIIVVKTPWIKPNQVIVFAGTPCFANMISLFEMLRSRMNYC